MINLNEIPKRYEDVKIEDIPENILTLFEKIKETRKGIYIHGGVGVGKTHSMYAMKKYWDDNPNNQICDCWNTSDLIQELRADYDRPKNEKKYTLDYLKDSKRLLILDDLGCEKITDWVLEKFYEIINTRYNHVRPVIITSNHSIPELAEKVGDRIVSRLVEMCDIVELTGDDRRIK